MFQYEFKQLKVDEALPNPFRPRFNIDRKKLIELSDSIRTYGVIEPILVAKTAAGYQIISGERRWKAAKLAGVATIPALITEVGATDMQMIFFELLRQHSPLNLLEQAAWIERLLKQSGLSLEQLADRMKRDPHDLERIIDTQKVAAKVKESYLKGEISDQQLLEFSAEKDQLTVLYKAKS